MDWVDVAATVLGILLSLLALGKYFYSIMENIAKAQSQHNEASIAALQKTLEKMCNEMEENRKTFNEINVCLAKISSSLASAHHRIDELKGARQR